MISPFFKSSHMLVIGVFCQGFSRQLRQAIDDLIVG